MSDSSYKQTISFYLYLFSSGEHLLLDSWDLATSIGQGCFTGMV